MYKFNLSEVGKRIQEVRGNENQVDFGKKLGLTQTQTSRLETGRAKKPQAELLLKICMESDPPINLHWLVTGAGSKYFGRSIDTDPNYDSRFELLVAGVRDIKKEGDYATLGEIQRLVEEFQKKN
jgi:transcriptional regulator with XRE-family HTH domain